MGLLAKAAFSKVEKALPGLLTRGQKKRDSLPPPGAALSLMGKAIQREIQKLHDNCASGGEPRNLQGIVLELPGSLPSGEMNHMVSALGTAMAIPPRRCLVLFSGAIDRELLAHRLSQSLETQILSVFMADNAQAVSDIIRPYL
ncbi:hypothetical protein AGMMS49579_15810 [Spirochaetia bacterium]|nr:hypothetical protein AGMMS49579_15810 [Spirochaetia bacterium]